MTTLVLQEFNIDERQQLVEYSIVHTKKEIGSDQGATRLLGLQLAEAERALDFAQILINSRFQPLWEKYVCEKEDNIRYGASPWRIAMAVVGEIFDGPSWNL
jgi:hypothetical protein